MPALTLNTAGGGMASPSATTTRPRRAPRTLVEAAFTAAVLFFENRFVVEKLPTNAEDLRAAEDAAATGDLRTDTRRHAACGVRAGRAMGEQMAAMVMCMLALYVDTCACCLDGLLFYISSHIRTQSSGALFRRKKRFPCGFILELIESGSYHTMPVTKEGPNLWRDLSMLSDLSKSQGVFCKFL